VLEASKQVMLIEFKAHRANKFRAYRQFFGLSLKKLSLILFPVIYTDVVQSLMMFAAMFLVIIKGTLDVGGLHYVIAKNIESGRIERPEYVDCY
jgi:hypothetical protein